LFRIAEVELWGNGWCSWAVSLPCPWVWV